MGSVNKELILKNILLFLAILKINVYLFRYL